MARGSPLRAAAIACSICAGQLRPARQPVDRRAAQDADQLARRRAFAPAVEPQRRIAPRGIEIVDRAPPRPASPRPRSRRSPATARLRARPAPASAPRSPRHSTNASTPYALPKSFLTSQRRIGRASSFRVRIARRAARPRARGRPVASPQQFAGEMQPAVGYQIAKLSLAERVIRGASARHEHKGIYMRKYFARRGCRGCPRHAGAGPRRRALRRHRRRHHARRGLRPGRHRPTARLDPLRQRLHRRLQAAASMSTPSPATTSACSASKANLATSASAPTSVRLDPALADDLGLVDGDFDVSSNGSVCVADGQWPARLRR